MVASSILKDHHHHRAAGPDQAPAAADGGGGGEAASAAAAGRAPVRSKQAEARRQAFVQAALKRCMARLGCSGEGGEGETEQGGGGDGDSEAAVVRRAVDGLLRSATSADNLSRMFEGWQAWL
jgi:hypothetical protein